MLVGRERELDRIEAELAKPGRVAAVFVHGPAGIGKTALLREATDRAVEASGYDLVWIDGRDIAPVPDQFEDALGAPPERERRGWSCSTASSTSRRSAATCAASCCPRCRPAPRS